MNKTHMGFAAIAVSFVAGAAIASATGVGWITGAYWGAAIGCGAFAGILSGDDEVKSCVMR